MNYVMKTQEFTKTDSFFRNDFTQSYNGLLKTIRPFNLQPFFYKSVEKWFEKCGWRNLVQEKWLTRKKDLGLKKHFSRKMVAD